MSKTPVVIEVVSHPKEVRWKVRVNGKTVKEPYTEFILNAYLKFAEELLEAAGVSYTVKRSEGI